MTELQILLNFLLSISNRYDVRFDIERVSKFLNYVYLQKDDKAFANFLADLLALDDAIVVGLNTGKFTYSSSVFSRYPQSCLPKFLRGVLSKVFDDDGNLLNNFCVEDVAILEGLRLVRRAQFPSLKKVAEKKAEDKFISYQRESRYTDPDTTDLLKQAWGFFAPESRFRDYLELGFPGNGVTTNMEFPYVPGLSFPDVRTCPTPLVTDILTQAVGLKLTGPVFDSGYPDCSLVKIYPFQQGERTANLAVVPKTCLIGRAITVTDTFSTILGATMRETLFSIANSWYLTRVFNVHDQTLSHKTLHSDFDTISLIDLEGGSSCLTLELLDTCLPEYLSSLHKACRPDFFVDSSGTRHQMNTLTMGDASSVALLTCTLGLAMTVAVFNFFCRRHKVNGAYLPFTHERWIHAVEFIIGDGRFHVVGDDMVFPSEFETEIRRVLLGIGVTINERKSSGENDRHKETCGCWVVKDPSGTHHSIFPYRCPDKTQPMNQRMMSTQAFIQRSVKSYVAADLAIAVTACLPFDDLLNYESYDLSSVGSPFGRIEPVYTYRSFSDDPAVLPDELSYAFGIEPGKCFPRNSKRPVVPKIGFRSAKKAPHLLFCSYSKTINKIRNSRKRRSNVQPLSRDLVEFLLSFMSASRLITLFA